MTPEAATDLKKNGGQNANFEGHYLLRNSPKLKKRGHVWPQKAVRNPKLGVIIAKCTLMTLCPPLAQPLLIIYVSVSRLNFLGIDKTPEQIMVVMMTDM